MKWKCTNVDKNKSLHCDLNTEELWSGDRKSTSWGRGGCAIKHVRAAWTVPLKGSGRPESGRQGGGVYLPSYIFWFGFGLGFQFFLEMTCLNVVNYHIHNDSWSLDDHNPPKKMIDVSNFSLVREASDPVRKGPPLWNFGISDELHFFFGKRR